VSPSKFAYQGFEYDWSVTHQSHISFCLSAYSITLEMSDNDIDFMRTGKELFAGGLAGTFGIIVGLPFDLVKVRLQVQPGLYSSGYDCFRKTLKSEGFKALYRGMMAPVLSQMPINSVLFAAEEAATRYLEGGSVVPKSEQKHSNQYIAGAFAGYIQCIVLVPFDRVKCLVQADGVTVGGTASATSQRKYAGTIDCAKKIFRNEGILGFYQGFTATAVREVPSLGVYFTTYKQLSIIFHELSQTYTWFPENIGTLLAGGSAGAASWMCVYPFDVIKTTIQTNTETINATATNVVQSTAPKRTNMGIISVARRLYGKHGIGVFFNGLGTTVLRAFPVNGITFLGYEKLKILLNI
jgi:solute carrier family 25 (mitochondrial carnitine/acylcarnitine transporter), member 20/29